MHVLKHCQNQASDKECKLNFKLRIPPPAYMLLFAAIMWLLDKQLPQMVWMDTQWNKLGWGIMALSVIPAAGAFHLFAYFNTTANPFNPETASKLVTQGVYRYTRNPMYLGLLLLLIGWAVYLGNLIALISPPLFAWVITTQQIRHEERALKKIFGEEYLTYKQRVRRWL